MPDDDTQPEPTRAMPPRSGEGGPPPTRVVPEATRAFGAQGAEASTDDTFAGMRIEDTTLTRRIGEGGMGVIYEGWQEPPGRAVAVKLLRQAVASAEARYRFQHEARVLASVRHAAVAQIHTVGTHRAAQELPYFLMEYVPDARTIDAYVAEHSLDLAATLGLFVQVCRGVQAGHAKGIIHRDLKPANILIDGEGHPKVIDFGIARVAEDEETAATPKTSTGEIVGTLPYMGPEQFTGQRGDVDTRTDVYALGVVLYEVLTGALPHDFGERGILDVIRMIQTEPPTPPEKLRPELAGDLAVVLGKAMAKDPERRYASAAALADDLERYLERRPILARPPSLRYQVRMYAKRRKGAFAAMLAVATSIVGALVAVSIFATSESRARAHAERQEAKARALLHESARFVPEIAEELDHRLSTIVGTSEARRLMASKLEALATRLAAVEGAADDPEVAHAMGAAEQAVANIRAGLGGANLGDGSASLERYERAVAHFARAHERVPGDARFRAALVDARLTLANQRRIMGHHDLAQRDLAGVEALLASWEQRHPGDEVLLQERFEYARALGHLMADKERPEDALAAYQQAHERVLAFAWPEDRLAGRTILLLQSHLDLATILVRMGRVEDAAPHIAQLVALADTLDTRRSNAKARSTLWHVHMKLGEFAERGGNHEAARDRHAKALALAQMAAADDPHDAAARMRVRVSRGELGASLEMLGDHEGAREHHAASLDAVREERQRDPGNDTLEWDLRVALVRLGTVEGQLGDLEASTRRLDAAREIQARRARLHADRIDEVAGVADIEYAAAVVALARAQRAKSLEENIAGYEAAAGYLRAAVKALEPLEADDRLRPSDASNLAAWRKTITALDEALGKLRAMR